MQQTLTTLELGSNSIGSKGAQHLADGLRNNNVNIFLCYLLFHLFVQTLIILNISSNTIGWKGAQHLADALQTNKVNLIRFI